jgi:hypothetical protein
VEKEIAKGMYLKIVMHFYRIGTAALIQMPALNAKTVATTTLKENEELMCSLHWQDAIAMRWTDGGREDAREDILYFDQRMGERKCCACVNICSLPRNDFDHILTFSCYIVDC